MDERVSTDAALVWMNSCVGTLIKIHGEKNLGKCVCGICLHTSESPDVNNQREAGARHQKHTWMSSVVMETRVNSH